MWVLISIISNSLRRHSLFPSLATGVVILHFLMLEFALGTWPRTYNDQWSIEIAISSAHKFQLRLCISDYHHLRRVVCYKSTCTIFWLLLVSKCVHTRCRVGTAYFEHCTNINYLIIDRLAFCREIYKFNSYEFVRSEGQSCKYMAKIYFKIELNLNVLVKWNKDEDINTKSRSMLSYERYRNRLTTNSIYLVSTPHFNGFLFRCHRDWFPFYSRSVCSNNLPS